MLGLKVLYVDGMIEFYLVCLFILSSIVWFIVSLIKFLKTPKELEDKKRQRRTLLIISSSILGTIIITLISLIILLMLAIANM